MRLKVLVVAVCTGLGVLVAPTAHAAADPGCDPIDPTACLLPFPNDWYTVHDSHTDTGRRVHLTAGETPRNVIGAPIQPAEWNRADGFSPGSMLLSHVPGVDLARSGVAPITDIGASLKPDAPIVIVDTATGEHWPYWAELDANATSDARRALIVRPARNFLEGHHYAVAFRDLRDGTGATIKPGPAFAKIIGATLPAADPLHARQAAERKVLAALARRGVGSNGLYLAWDFTVASERSLAGPSLHIRDDALAKLGGKSPQFVVTSAKDTDGPIAREVTGFVNVPSYLNVPGGTPGSAFHYGKDGLPSQWFGNIQWAPFQCEIPRAALTTPGHAALYGHGLLGSESEVGAGNVKAMAAEHDFVFCATKWAGLSSDDLVNVFTVLTDLSRFNTVADRLQQGMLNFQFLGRAMLRGFGADKAFQGPDGRSVIDTGSLTYDGNSQGGIMGGALTAVSKDIRRAVLGVPAMNYSTLLDRSADFAQYSQVLNLAYPDKLDQQLDLALIQMLWDRGEADGYAQHLTTSPLPGTPSHRVLMHTAFGDHQVATVAAEVEARTIGARLHTPALTAGRSPDKVPFWGIPAIPAYPYAGSALVMWDSGSPAPPLGDTPPTAGHDPHSDPRSAAVARTQKSVFLTTGQVTDVCAGTPCVIPPAQ